MHNLDITDALLRQLLDQVGPLVEQVTGWDLQFDGLACRVIPRERGYEEILLARLRGAGVEVDDGPRSLGDRLLEYVLEGNLLAAYEPSRHELLLVRENVNESNLDGVRVVIGHELVHRGQHLYHPELFDRLDATTREIVPLLSRITRLRKVMRLVDEIQPVMTLLESHAAYVQEHLRLSYFPSARVQAHVTAPALLLRLAGRRKLSQYTEAVPAVAEAMANGQIEALYQEVRARAP